MFSVAMPWMPRLFGKEKPMPSTDRRAIPRPPGSEPAPVQRLEPRFNLPGFISDYEAGVLSEEAVVAGFQRLIDSGLAWSLQGSYGRTARMLIDRGDCHLPGAPTEM